MKIAIIILTSIAWVVPAQSNHAHRLMLEHSLPGIAMMAELAMPILGPQEEANGRQATNTAKQEAKHGSNEAQIWVGWLNALSTAVIAVFAVVACIFLSRQGRVTRRLERAWISGSPQSFNLEATPDSGETRSFECLLKNVGRTPARIMETGLALRKADSLAVIPMEPQYTGKEQHSFNGPILAPNDSFMISASVGNLSPEDCLALKKSKLAIYAYGYVKYKDMFESYHETRFCYYYRVRGTQEPQSEGFELCVEAPRSYHRAT